MNFIVDTHLPPRLAKVLTEIGHDSWHVDEIAALDAPDSAIWTIAQARDCAIITKDSDFLRLSLQSGGAVPVPLLRMGNCSRNVVIDAVCRRLLAVVAALTAGEPVVEIR